MSAASKACQQLVKHVSSTDNGERMTWKLGAYTTNRAISMCITNFTTNLSVCVLLALLLAYFADNCGQMTWKLGAYTKKGAISVSGAHDTYS